MECMLSMSVFGHLRHLWIGEDGLKGDEIVGCFIFCYLLVMSTSSIHPSRLVPRQTWRPTGFTKIYSGDSNPPARARVSGARFGLPPFYMVDPFSDIPFLADFQEPSISLHWYLHNETSPDFVYR